MISHFQVQPIIDGYSSDSNAHYRSASYSAKATLRLVVHNIAPG